MEKKQISIGKDAAKLTFVKIFSMGLSMISAMLLSRFRTLNEYGTYSQILLVTSLAYSIFSMGLPNSINYFLAGEYNVAKRAKFIKTFYTSNTIMGVICGLGLFALVPVIQNYFGNDLIYKFAFVLILYPWVKLINSGMENLFIVYNKANKLIWFQLRYGITTLIIIFIALYFNLSFYIYMIMLMVVEIGFAFFIYYLSWKITGVIPIGKFDFALFKTILKFSIPIGLANIVGTLNIELDKLIIGGFLDTESLAIYTNASKEMPVAIISGSITAVLMPQMRRLLKKGHNEEAVDLWSDSITIAFIFICFISAVLFVFAPQAMSILYSPKYLPGVNVFRVYLLALLLRVTYWGMILNCIGKTKMVLYSSIGSLVINVILNYILYLIFGMIGPAIATLISITLMTLWQLRVTSKKINISFKKIIPWIKLLKIVLFNLVLGSVAYFINISLGTQLDFIGYMRCGLIIVVWAALYFRFHYKNIRIIWKRLK